MPPKGKKKDVSFITALFCLGWQKGISNEGKIQWENGWKSRTPNAGLTPLERLYREFWSLKNDFWSRSWKSFWWTQGKRIAKKAETVLYFAHFSIFWQRGQFQF